MNERRFKECVMPLHKTLYAIAFSILREECDAQDCLQETFTKLWENRSRLDEVENVQAYASMTVRNVAITFAKRRQMSVLQGDPPPDIPDPSPTPHSKAEGKDEVRKMARILSTLPENQRKVIMLNGVAGLSNQEIRDLTGLTDDNVRVLLSRARKKLRQLFLNS